MKLVALRLELAPLFAGVLALSLVASGCGRNPVFELEPGELLDAGELGNGADASGHEDGGELQGDAANPPDAWTPDTAILSDAGAAGADAEPEDAEPSDGAEPRDAELGDAGGANPDATPPADGGIVRDAGPADGGVTPDAGPQCTTDRDCPLISGARRCEPTTGTCVGCYDNGHCTAGLSCDIGGSNTCRPNCVAGRCGPLGVCDAATNLCVECLSDSDCRSGYCDTQQRRCVACASDAHCAQNPGRNLCDPGSNECVGCVSDASCPAGEVCHASQGGFCAEPTGRGLCAPCAQDGDCGGPNDLCVGYVGNNGIFDRSCATACSNAAPCPSGYDCVPVRSGSAQVCRPRYAMQTPTCTAIRNLGAACAHSSTEPDPGCGLPAVQDARCFPSVGTTGVCVVWCDNPGDCPSGFTCTQAGQQRVCL